MRQPPGRLPCVSRGRDLDFRAYSVRHSTTSPKVKPPSLVLPLGLAACTCQFKLEVRWVLP
jgi:hypothetical protein